MSDRLVPINDNGLPKFIDATQYAGQSASIKKGSKLSYWFGRSVKYKGEYLNKTSSIKFFNLKKGFLGIGRSSNQEINKAFKNYFSSIVSSESPQIREVQSVAQQISPIPQVNSSAQVDPFPQIREVPSVLPQQISPTSQVNPPALVNSSPSVTSSPQVKSATKSYIEIPQDTVKKLLEITQKKGEPEVGNLILKSWLTPPSDPFDLYLYNVLTQFRFPNARSPNQFQKSRKYIDAHIQKNLNLQNYTNPTELQRLHACIEGFDVRKKGLYRFPNNPDDADASGALTSLDINSLLAAYRRYHENPNSIVFLDTTGDNYLEGKDPKNKIVYCADMPFHFLK